MCLVALDRAAVCLSGRFSADDGQHSVCAALHLLPCHLYPAQELFAHSHDDVCHLLQPFFAYKVNGMVMWMLPLTACINYAVTQEMRLHEGKARKALLTFVVLVDLALLCYFKYTNFIIGDVVNEMFSTNFSLQSIALPVGISFYTFQAISYAVDTYKRKFDMEVTLLEYCFYLTFFPLLMAGPITRAANLIPRLKRNEQASSRMLWTGLFLIMLGLVKKNMLSDYIAQFNNWVFDAPQTFSGFENLAALFGYPVQIFLDFRDTAI